MADTNEVVLITLEQGDTVVFRDGQKAIVNHVSENYSEGFTVYFSYTENLDYQRNNDYLQNGETQFSFNTDNDIIEIIKNPKKWTDDDMMAACQLGIDTQFNDARCLGSVINFRKWLEHYKAAKNDTI